MYKDLITIACSIGGTAITLIGKEIIKYTIMIIKNKERKLEKITKKLKKLNGEK